MYIWSGLARLKIKKAGPVMSYFTVSQLSSWKLLLDNMLSVCLNSFSSSQLLLLYYFKGLKCPSNPPKPFIPIFYSIMGLFFLFLLLQPSIIIYILELVERRGSWRLSG